jgi:hypothetical protein
MPGATLDLRDRLGCAGWATKTGGTRWSTSGSGRVLTGIGEEGI